MVINSEDLVFINGDLLKQNEKKKSHAFFILEEVSTENKEK